MDSCTTSAIINRQVERNRVKVRILIDEIVNTSPLDFVEACEVVKAIAARERGFHDKKASE